MSIFSEVVETGSLVFDVGSNIGDKSEQFLNLGARVVAFEPQKECFDFAVTRFKNNANYIAENIALDSKAGVSQIKIANFDTISSMSEDFIREVKKERFATCSWSVARQITTDTLDNMISKHGKPSFIKIDVEGFELNVLKGLSSSIDVISVEFTPELCHASVACMNYVDALNNGRSVFNYGYRNDENFKFSGWLTMGEILKYLKSVDDYRFEFGDIYCKKLAK